MILFYEITEFVLSEYLTLPDRIERPAAVAGVALCLPFPISMCTAVAPSETPINMPINCPRVFFQLIDLIL